MTDVRRRCEDCGRAMRGRADVRIRRASDGLMVCLMCDEAGVRMTGPTRTRVAHGGGDGQELRHCTFCGSGGIVGRSDGTTECTLCGKVFTVQVQPAQSFAPQTVDGQPVHIPGMPNSPSAEQAPSSPVAPGAPEPEPADATVGVPGFSDDEIDLFQTATGAVLDRDAYVRHLALSVPGVDRDEVLARIRANATRSTVGHD